VTNRSSLSLTSVIALLAWAGLFTFTDFVPPHTLLAFVAFFLILYVALMGTFTPIAYALGRLLLIRRRYFVTLGYAFRQATLLTLVIVLNLILRALHSWNIFTGLVILAAAIITEILALARK
jgi:ABC-type maltose transport system permease subunit